VNQRTSTSVVVINKSSQFLSHQQQRRTYKQSNGQSGSISFVPSSGTHSRQRSPVLGALGKEAKLFQATMPSSQITLGDKKLENLNSSFNLTMIPITSGMNQSQYVEGQQTTVKELEEEEEEEKCLAVSKPNRSQLHPSLHAGPHHQLNETSATTNLADVTTLDLEASTTSTALPMVSTPKETSEQIRERCKDRIDGYRRDVKREMPLSDQLDMRDPQCIAEYAQEVF
jgi:hypothetical protein